MLPGPDLFYKCPSCGAVIKNRSLMSGNTFGATYFSDGRRIAPMLPSFPNLTKCQKCNTIFWLMDLEKLGEMSAFSEADYSDHPGWKDAFEPEHLELEDLCRALEVKDVVKNKDREIFIRKRIWWAYNNNHDKNIDEVNAWCENCFKLLELLNLEEEDQYCMAVELYRNLGDFAKCLNLARKLPDNYKVFKLLTMEACCNLDRRTFEIDQDRKIDEEGTYDILQNKDNELLFCIGEYEDEPDNPHIIYNGGNLAVLYRSCNHAVVLDLIHPGVHEQLKLVKQVLIAECVRNENESASEKLESGLVREYMAEVR
jgi:hypothetical protein